MELIPIVYTTLIIFSALAAVVLIISFISFKIRQKNSDEQTPEQRVLEAEKKKAEIKKARQEAEAKTKRSSSSSHSSSSSGRSRSSSSSSRRDDDGSPRRDYPKDTREMRETRVKIERDRDRHRDKEERERRYKHEQESKKRTPTREQRIQVLKSLSGNNKASGKYNSDSPNADLFSLGDEIYDKYSDRDSDEFKSLRVSKDKKRRRDDD